eukprot:Colp12_sorted_trinity150504_noHs@7755
MDFLRRRSASFFKPTTKLDLFIQSWTAVQKGFQNVDESGELDANMVAHLDNMCTVLIEEMSGKDVIVPCFEYLVDKQILQTLQSLTVADYPKGIRNQLVKFYNNMLKGVKEPLVANMPVLIPLKRLLVTCIDADSDLEESPFLELLHTLCIHLQRDRGENLVLFFENDPHKARNSEGEIVPEFPILAALSRYVFDYGHKSELTESRARTSLLLCLQMSKLDSKFSRFIVEHSDIGRIIVYGLGALYSTLPTSLSSSVDITDVHAVTSLPQMSTFLSAIHYINAVLEVSSLNCDHTFKTRLLVSAQPPRYTSWSFSKH